ncbi:MAG: hypothetical protein RL076_1267 [Chloroflexota bacterium]|jgi:hypothetical protein
MEEFCDDSLDSDGAQPLCVGSLCELANESPCQFYGRSFAPP